MYDEILRIQARLIWNVNYFVSLVEDKKNVEDKFIFIFETINEIISKLYDSKIYYPSWKIIAYNVLSQDARIFIKSDIKFCNQNRDLLKDHIWEWFEYHYNFRKNLLLPVAKQIDNLYREYKYLHKKSGRYLTKRGFYSEAAIIIKNFVKDEVKYDLKKNEKEVIKEILNLFNLRDLLPQIYNAYKKI